MARPSSSGVGDIVGAVVETLRAAPEVTAIVPADRILNYVSSGTPRPYLRVDVTTETDDDTLGLGGVDAICAVTAVSDYRGAAEIGRMAAACRRALDGIAMDVDGFTAPGDVSYEQAIGEFTEDVAGIAVRHRPLWFRVRVL